MIIELQRKGGMIVETHLFLHAWCRQSPTVSSLLLAFCPHMPCSCLSLRLGSGQGKLHKRS